MPRLKPSATTTPVLILDSRFWGKHISGGKFDAFLNVFLYFRCFSGGGGEFGILGGNSPPPPQEIAGNNTAQHFNNIHVDNYFQHIYLLLTIGEIFTLMYIMFLKVISNK